MILIIGLASVFYTSAGGLQSVVWTDALQFMLMATGAVATLVVVAFQTGIGPVEWWYEIARQNHDSLPLVSWDVTHRHTWLGTIFFGLIVNLCYNASDQVIVQRYFATRQARTMMIANYVAGVTLSLLLAAVGATLVVYYQVFPSQLPAGIPDVTSPNFADKAFPHFIVTGLPVGLTGLVIAALLGAAQSTLDSGVNSLAAVFSKNLRPTCKDHDSVTAELSRARWATRVIGGGIILMAIIADNLPGANNIIDVAQKFVHLGLGPMGALFMVAMSLKCVNTSAAVLSLLIGIASAIFFAFSDSLIGRPLISPILIIPSSWLITLFVAVSFGTIFQALRLLSSSKRGHHQGRT
jgi:SSS family solute:Na+ symporter